MGWDWIDGDGRQSEHFDGRQTYLWRKIFRASKLFPHSVWVFIGTDGLFFLEPNIEFASVPTTIDSLL